MIRQVSHAQIFKQQSWGSDANYTEFLKTSRVAAHWVKLAPQAKSSDPHAESTEEEIIYVVKGQPHVWIDGYIFKLHAGLVVGFPAGTGIAHCFINNTDTEIELIVLGERTKKDNRCYFPLHKERKFQDPDFWWEPKPLIEVGPHKSEVGDLSHEKKWQDCTFIKNVYELERMKPFSYNQDVESFGHGVRLTNHVGLKFMGLWHEKLPVMKRSSWPHCHKIEEEMAIITKGRVQVWQNGQMSEARVGDCVYFKPNTNEAHVLINNGAEEVEYLSVGEVDDSAPEEKIVYPLHATRNEECLEKGYLWQDAPAVPEIGNALDVPLITNHKIELLSNVSEFLKLSSEFIYKREAEYSLMIGLCEAKQKIQPANDIYKYITITQSGVLQGCAVLTDLNLILTHVSGPLCYRLAEFCVEQNMNVTGVVGPAHSSEAFTRFYNRVSSSKFLLGMGQKIYKLEQVNAEILQNAKGELVQAEPNHLGLTTQWLAAFIKEALPHQPTETEALRKDLQNRISKGLVYLWKNSEGQMVSMNFVTRPTENGISVGGVYTPPELRGKSYASLVVAASSKIMLDRGKKFCVLYTDTNNPTSNSIYQKIGYKEIAISKQFVLK
jgi:uncharacterized cupin superfamily protein/predicted GNAT family acetyltransferase